MFNISLKNRRILLKTLKYFGVFTLTAVLFGASAALLQEYFLLLIALVGMFVAIWVLAKNKVETEMEKEQKLVDDISKLR